MTDEAEIVQLELRFAYDPVYQGADGLWYWYDETWSNVYGPYDLESQARTDLQTYCEQELMSA